ncbi:MAG TPA: SBBP repeat-containing protein, partial [Ignavibacteria bacterium]|nr:SBBP repeat-containing protein [Ignavibacteria bacterium]
LGLATDYTTIKYDSNGNQLWVATYNGPASLFDEANAIAVDDSGNVYVTGFSYGLLSLSLSDYATIKYDPNGNEVWVKRYNGSLLGDDVATDIIIDSQGDIIITGYSSALLGSRNFVTIKYSSSGAELWTASYNGPANSEDMAYALAEDGNGYVYVVGHSNSNFLLGNPDYALVKYSISDGSEQWVRRYNGPGNSTDKAYAIVVDNSDNVIITGESRSSSEDYATIKYNSAGTQQWVRRYNGPGNNTDKAYAIIVDNSDNVIVTGESRNSQNEDYATIKYNPAGTEQWVRRYNGPGNGTDKAYAIVIDNSDNVLVTGASDSTSTAEDYTTVGYDPAGNQIFETRYNGPGNSTDKAYAIVVDNSDNFYITGGSRSGLILTSEDYATVKYSMEKTVTNIQNNEPFNYSLSQNFPNPFNPVTNIKFSISKNSNAKIVVYNFLGMAVDEYSYTGIAPGSYDLKWDASGKASGLYFYKIIVNDASTGEKVFEEVRKMVLIK